MGCVEAQGKVAGELNLDSGGGGEGRGTDRKKAEEIMSKLRLKG